MSKKTRLPPSRAGDGGNGDDPLGSDKSGGARSYASELGGSGGPTKPTRRPDPVLETRLPDYATEGRLRAGADDGVSLAVPGLPENLLARYDEWRQLPTRGAEADLYLVRGRDDGKEYIAKIYRYLVEPNFDVLNRTVSAHRAHVIQLFDTGMANGRAYEIQEYARHGSLKDFLDELSRKRAASRERERVAEDVLRELAAAIDHLHQQGIHHRDIKPDNILIRALDPLDLVLADFGVATEGLTGLTMHHTKNLRGTVEYSPPEAEVGGTSHRIDYWALGMILVEVLTGEHPFSGMQRADIRIALSSRPIDLGAVENTNWRKLCAGLLTRDYSHRWTRSEVARWRPDFDDPSLKVHHESASPPKSAGQLKAFTLAGSQHTSLESLARGLAKEWEEGIQQYSRGYLETYLKQVVVDNVLWGLASKKVSEPGRADEALLNLIMALDPSFAPPVLGKFDITGGTESLLELARLASSGSKPARRAITMLSKTEALHSYADARGDPEFSYIADQWKASLREIRPLQNELNKIDIPAIAGVLKINDAVLAADVLILQLSSAEWKSQLQQIRAAPEFQAALNYSWFQALTDKMEEMPGALIFARQLMGLGATLHAQRVAETEAEERKRAAEVERERQLKARVQRAKEMETEARRKALRARKWAAIRRGVGYGAVPCLFFVLVLAAGDSVPMMMAISSIIGGIVLAIAISNWWGILGGIVGGLIAFPVAIWATSIPFRYLIGVPGWSYTAAGIVNVCAYLGAGALIGLLVASVITDTES